MPERTHTMTKYIPDTSYNPAFPAEWEGLGYESAEACTPHWYGVSSGNGNDGVSHLYPDYYVRTCEPYTLAQAAIVAELRPAYYEWALENSEVDGESDYTIQACIYNPPDDEIDHSECEDGDDCTGCHECEGNDYCSANGAWLIIEVFPASEDDMRKSRMLDYDSLDEALSADVVALAREAE